ncbi:MAG: hypothetical protein NZ874_01080 [Fimbriimonadales bacterium]|nr:hypothetical protein [Fimbriimonadales bacterium]
MASASSPTTVLLETPIGKRFQLEIVSFLQGRLGTCPYPEYPVGARPRRAQSETISTVRHLPSEKGYARR